MSSAVTLEEIAARIEEPAPLVPASFSDVPGWHCYQTERAREHRAKLRIESDGFEVLCPFFKKWVRGGRNLKVSDRQPVFPGYLFVRSITERLPDIREWRPFGVRSLFAYHSSLAGDPVPYRMPTDFIEDLARRDAEGEFDLTVAKPSANRPEMTEQELTKRGLAVGGMARVGEGKFAGFFAQIMKATSRQRVELLISDIMGRDVRVQADVASLWPA